MPSRTAIRNKASAPGGSAKSETVLERLTGAEPVWLGAWTCVPAATLVGVQRGDYYAVLRLDIGGITHDYAVTGIAGEAPIGTTVSIMVVADGTADVRVVP